MRVRARCVRFVLAAAATDAATATVRFTQRGWTANGQEQILPVADHNRRLCGQRRRSVPRRRRKRVARGRRTGTAEGHQHIGCVRLVLIELSCDPVVWRCFGISRCFLIQLRFAARSAVEVVRHRAGGRSERVALLTEVPRAVAASLRFLRTGFVRAQPAPLLAVELLPDAGRRRDDVTLLESVRCGRLRSWSCWLRSRCTSLVQ